MDLNKIEEQLKKVPEEVKKLFFSVETARQIQSIGESYDLMLDQIDTLIEETGLTMIGLKPSNSFVETISSSLGIKGDLAKKIANEINSKVLSSIKTESRVVAENNTPGEERVNEDVTTSSISSLERAGGITIEKAPLESGAQVTSADRGQILAGLENPPSWSNNTPAAPTNLPVGNGPIASFGAQPTVENHTEPLVDYLLSNASAQKSETVSAAATSAPKPQTPKPAPQAPKGPDPYREEPK